jgi:hypothetical protein
LTSTDRFRLLPEDTVTASNFGPNGSFGYCLASCVTSLDESCTEKEQKQMYKSVVHISFSSFFVGRVLLIAGLSEKSPQCPKLEVLTVTVFYPIALHG